MHLIVNGSVKVGDHGGSGKLLLTDRSLFAFKSKTESPDILGAVAGWAGTIISLLFKLLVHGFKKDEAPPAHFNDPEIAGLEESERKELADMELLAQLPLDSNLSVEPTRFGILFKLGPTVVKYSGWTKKQEILRFLDTHGIRIPPTAR